MRDIRYQAAVVRNNHLLVVEVTLRNGECFWLLPGGGREADDTSAEACVAREVREETGLEVVVEGLLSALPAHAEQKTYQWMHTWLCTVREGEAVAGAADGTARVSDVAWLDLDDESGWADAIRGDRLLHPQLLRIREMLRLRGWPTS